ncbi:MAG: thioesterase domain-containing protein [Pseudomonadota bacterium]
MFGFLKSTTTKLIVVSLAATLSACSSSKKVEPKVQAQKPVVQAALKQRPSEINISIKGKVTRTGEVYLLRGLANVFSRGMDTLGAKMVRKGLDARVYNHAAWRDLADNILARAKKKQVSYPVVIMGHSLGANASAHMAKYLGDRGIRVDYVVAFDPTVTTAVGKNVRRVINFYLPNDGHTNVVKKAPGFKGVLKNINVRGVRGLTHTTVEKDAKFHAEVIQRTLSYTKRRRNKRT